MKILYWDTFAGISGDMALGSLIALGADPEEIIEQLHSIGLNEFKLEITSRQVHGIQATDVDVIVLDTDGSGHGHEHRHEHEHEHSHKHKHDHDHDHSHAPEHNHELDHDGHEHDHEHKHEHDHAHDQVQVSGQGHNHEHLHPHEHSHSGDHHDRHLPGIQQMIVSGKLSERAKNHALSVFQVLAEGEAEVHGTTPDNVHFHEVGAVDSLVDIVGTCIALDLLDIEQIRIPVLPWSTGFVNCAHGTIPLPAPAALMLLKGFKFRESGITGELITPTGAALVKALAEQADFPEMVVRQVGYGSGKNDYGIPSLLRGVIGEI